MRDSFVFYKSFFDAASHLPDDQRLAVYDAICRYALNGEEPEGDGLVMAIMSLVRPQLDANQKRYENGKKGGRPIQEETKPEPKQNQTITKAKPKHNQTKTTPEPNVNVNVNVNDNENVNDIKDVCPEPVVSEPADVEGIPLNDGTEWKPSVDEYAEYCRLYPAVNVKMQIALMRGWCVANRERRKTRKGIRRFVNSWLSREQNNSQTRAAPAVKKNGFTDIDERQYDFDALERAVLRR